LNLPRSIRVLIADDHALFRAGLIHLISGIADEVSAIEANSLDEAIIHIDPSATPDLMLVDLMMPGMGDGAAGIRRLRELAPDMPLVVLSVKDHSDDVRQAIDSGALGYIPKSTSPEVMLSALKLVLAGGVYLPAELIGASAGAAETSARADSSAGLRSLTARQQEVLALLAEGKTNKEIARNLGLSTGTIKAYVSDILRSLGAENRTQAAAIALTRSHDQIKSGG